MHFIASQSTPLLYIKRSKHSVRKEGLMLSFCKDNLCLYEILFYVIIQDMTSKKEKLLIYLAATSAGTLLISNLSAVKIWDLFGIPVDGGLVVFPIIYILGDLIVEFYGKEISRSMIFASFLINLLAIFVFYIVIALPSYPEWSMQQAYQAVVGFTPRIIIGSLSAYVCSNLFNNYIFTKLKNGQGLFARSFLARALGSSAFARIIDSLIFEIIAFLGVLSFKEFILQACFAYLLGFIFEILLSPIELLIANQIRRKYDSI